jgi:hypothetical protein
VSAWQPGQLLQDIHSCQVDGQVFVDGALSSRAALLCSACTQTRQACPDGHDGPQHGVARQPLHSTLTLTPLVPQCCVGSDMQQEHCIDNAKGHCQRASSGYRPSKHHTTHDPGQGTYPRIQQHSWSLLSTAMLATKVQATLYKAESQLCARDDTTGKMLGSLNLARAFLHSTSLATDSQPSCSPA